MIRKFKTIEHFKRWWASRRLGGQCSRAAKMNEYNLKKLAMTEKYQTELHTLRSLYLTEKMELKDKLDLDLSNLAKDYKVAE